MIAISQNEILVMTHPSAVICKSSSVVFVRMVPASKFAGTQILSRWLL
jgi:hypothetical protein